MRNFSTFGRPYSKRAQRELDRVADLSFRFEPIIEGRQTLGWNFTVVANRPEVVKGTRRALPESPVEPIAEPTEEELAKGRAMLAEVKAKVREAA